MGPPEMLRELSALARRLGVGLRFDEFEGKQGGPARRGGLCRLHGQSMIVVDEGLPLLDQIEIVAGALSTFDLEKVFVPPELRLRLERRVAGRDPTPPARPHPRPLSAGGEGRPLATGGSPSPPAERGLGGEVCGRHGLTATGPTLRKARSRPRAQG